MALVCLLLYLGVFVRTAMALGGRIDEDLILRLSDSPHEVHSDVIVGKKAKLTIEPGVELRFAPGSGLTVRGILDAQGYPSQRIVFTRLRQPNTWSQPDSFGYRWPEVRLVDGASILEGRLQLLYRDKWRSVCTNSRNWTELDINVMCRQLGFTGGLLYKWFDRTNDSSQLLYENPNCTGEEISLSDCSNWDRRQLGSGVCDYHQDIGIRCEDILPSDTASYWKGIRFQDAQHQDVRMIGSSVFRKESISILRNVDIRFAGRNFDGRVTSALETLGVPPRIQGLDIRWSAYNGMNITRPGSSFDIEDTVISENRGYGLYINTSSETVNLHKLKIMDNGGDGVKYNFHDIEAFSPNSFCRNPSFGRNQAYPVSLTYTPVPGYMSECKQMFEVSNLYEETLTVHFLTLISDEYNASKAGIIDVYDGRSSNSRLLASVPVMNNTRPQSVSSSRDAIFLLFRPPSQGMIMFTLQVTTGLGKSYDVNITDSTISNNNGRGIAIENQRSGIVINRTTVSDNSHVAGFHVFDGSGDVIVNNSIISNNFGDGVNISFTGGFVHFYNTKLFNNSGRGLAMWFNETSQKLAFNYTTQFAYSEVINNRLNGLFLGNICRSDSFWNISMNTFQGNKDHAVMFLSCWSHIAKNATFLLTHNIFLESAMMSLFMSPVFHVHARIEHNTFYGHTKGVLYLSNNELDNFSKVPANVFIQYNNFTKNAGVFVANIGLSQKTTNNQKLIFTKNRLYENIIQEPFSGLNPRSRVAAVVVVSSSSAHIFRNYLKNPESKYELGCHLEAHNKIINASLNYWGLTSATAVYKRIFDRKDRYNLARVEFLQFILHPSDLDTVQAISDEHERDKIMPFFNDNEIGGEVAGVISLDGREYIVRRDIFVRPKSKLIINPGATLKFEKSIGMMVQGLLLAEGEDRHDAKVSFTMHGESKSAMKSMSVSLSRGTEGILEVNMDNNRGAVCSYGWDMKDAAVACHQLGLVLHPEDWLLERSEYLDSETQNIILTNVRCNDWDTDITECKSEREEDFENSCNMPVGIRCYRPSWSGIRLGMAAQESIMKNLVIEGAGLMDYTTHMFKPAIQIDFNQHRMENLVVRQNTDSGLGVMWNNFFDGSPTLKNSLIQDNGVHGIVTRSQGIHVENCQLRSNLGSGFHYEPVFSKREQRDLISWIDKDDSSHVMRVPDSVGDNVLFIGAREKKVVLFTEEKLTTPRRFDIVTEHRWRIGIMVLNPFSNDSTQNLHISIMPDEDWIDLRKNLTSFPLRSLGSRLTVEYTSGKFPDNSAIMYLTSVEENKKSAVENFPTIRIKSNAIEGCGNGISTRHYNRDISETGDYFHRYNNESFIITDTDISDSKREAIFVSTPYWDPLVSSLAEINYTIINSRIEKNTRGIVQYSRDLRNSNNLFHWVINDTNVVENFGGGLNIRLPYVWHYSENYTHTFAMYNTVFEKNRHFEFIIGGHYAAVNISNNAFRNNTCKTGLITISGMEKKLLIEDNVVESNEGHFAVDFKLQSHADKFGLVPANFKRNFIKGNTGGREGEIEYYQPTTYAISIRGIQQVNITRNLLSNPDMQFELMAGVLSGSLENSINVTENWWGTDNVSVIQKRIFDFDDWNSFAVVEFNPFLSFENLNAPIITAIISESLLNFKEPLGGRIRKSVTLKGSSQPYVVKSDLTVMPNAVLTLEPGVTIEFYPSVGILVLGDLIARGSELAPITLRPTIMMDTRYRFKRQVYYSTVRLCIDEVCEDDRSDGFLEIFNSTTYQWVPVCDPLFSERNAQVVCKELGFSTLNVHVKHGPRLDLGLTQINRVRSWPNPLECSGEEPTLNECEIRLNGYVKRTHECPYLGNFTYIICGHGVLNEGQEHWGGIRFASSIFETKTKIFHGPTLSYSNTPSSVLRHVKIIGAGILHGEKSAALQSLFRDVRVDFVSVTKSASHGIQMVTPTGQLYFNNLSVRNNLGVGISFVVLTGESSESSTLSYLPLKQTDLPYNVFGMVDMCDTNKELIVEERLLLYYKYDNRPVDCVKIFNSRYYGKQVGFRLLQFNLLNSTRFSAQPDVIRIYDGDIFNTSISMLGRIGVEYTSGSPPEMQFYRSSDSTLSVQLHTTGGSGVYGFIAEVVTLPISYIIRRHQEHNISFSDVSYNQMEGVAYRSAGEITPRITLSFNRFEGNGREYFGNFTTCNSAVLFDIQNVLYLYFYNNILLKNQGGLHISADSQTPLASLNGDITNNLFTQNNNREVLLVRRQMPGSYQFVTILGNYFTRNSARYRNTIMLSQVVSNFTKNLIYNNTGQHILYLQGFDRVPVSYQVVNRNWFSQNIATQIDDRSTIVASSAGQIITYNYMVNPENDFEVTATNRTSIEVKEAPINASFNWWGFNETSAISGRIKDNNDYIQLLPVDFNFYTKDNSSVLSGKCASGWEKVGDTCFLYIGGIFTYSEAKKFCEMDNASIPYVKNNHEELMEFVEKEQTYFRWYHDLVWVQSVDIPLRECAVLYRGRVQRHSCDDNLPFLCERDPDITVTAQQWYQESLAIVALSVTSLSIIFIVVCISCWFCKSRQRYQEKLERRNSIRNSRRSLQSSFSDLGYKRRLEKGLKPVTEFKINGSVDSIEKAPSRFSCFMDDSQSYDTSDARNPNIVYADFTERFPPQRPVATVSAEALPQPTFDLTYENQGYMERSLSRTSHEGSRDWSSATDSTLDMKRSLERESKDDTFQSTPSPRLSSRYSNNGAAGGSSSASSMRRPLETEM